MNGRDYSLHRLLHGAVLLWLFWNITLIGQVEGQTYPLPVGAGIVATLAADQNICYDSLRMKQWKKSMTRKKWIL
jgi:hypothetical protein